MSDRVLIIGGAGFIGIAVVEDLLAHGRDVTIVSRAGEPSDGICPLVEEFGDRVRYAAGDCRDFDFLQACVPGHSHLIHLAYTWSTEISSESGETELTENLKLAESVFSVAVGNNMSVVLVSSGGTVYGETAQPLIAEEHRTNPVSIYGFTKLATEMYADYYAQTRGLKYTCLRLGNAYGKGQEPFRGQGFIATAIGSIINGQAVRIFGEGGTVRDYLYISDVAAAIRLSLRLSFNNVTYNIGSGSGYSNRQILDVLIPIVERDGFPIETETLPSRQHDVSRNVLDSTRFTEATGWRPEVGLESGLEKTFQWLKSR